MTQNSQDTARAPSKDANHASAPTTPPTLGQQGTDSSPTTQSTSQPTTLPTSQPAHQPISVGPKVRCGVMTVSNTRDPLTDHVGRVIQKMLTDARHEVIAYEQVGTDPDDVSTLLVRWLDDPRIQVVIINGGTELVSGDGVLSAVESRFTTPIPGFGHLLRTLSWPGSGSGAMLLRATAGIAAGKVIFLFPGSPATADLAMNKLILPEIAHLTKVIER